jgi:hypothetical protein
MGTNTDVGMVGLGGACAFVLVWLIQAFWPTAPVTPELSVAFGTIFTIVFTYLSPALSRSRGSESSSETEVIDPATGERRIRRNR